MAYNIPIVDLAHSLWKVEQVEDVKEAVAKEVPGLCVGNRGSSH